MKKRLFLTGPSNCGKSALIRSMLGKRMQGAGGFVTYKNYNESGTLCTYELLPAAAAAGIQGFEARKFLDYTVNPPKSDNEVFRNLGTQLVQEALYYPYAVLDEFGGTDLLIPQYRAALQELFNSDLPCIGVIKSVGEIAKLKNDLGLTERFMTLTENLRNVLVSDEDTLILETTGKGDTKALRIIQQWISEYA